MIKILKEDLNNPNFFYQKIVESILADVNNTFLLNPLRNQKYTFKYSWPYEVDPEEYDEYLSKNFVVNFSLKKINRKLLKGFNVSGDAGLEDDYTPNINVEIEFNDFAKLTPPSTIDLYLSLANTLAHEIHHLTQQGPLKSIHDSAFTSLNKAKDFFSYLNNQLEIPAWIIGFRAEAYYSKLEISFHMKDYLDSYVNLSLLSPKESEEIFQIWKAYVF